MNQLNAIHHFVVIMLENRSFDHMLGFLYSDNGNVSPAGHAFEGLTGNESNQDENGAPVKVFPITKETPNAYFMPKANPGEGFLATNSQLFGSPFPKDTKTPPKNHGFVNDFNYTIGWEKKDHWNVLPDTKPADTLGMYTPETLPVLSALAKSYAVCDHWYASAPTETLPNRAFFHMATSQGRLDDKDKVYTAPSIFGKLSAKGIDWVCYGCDSKPLSRHSIAQITDDSNDHFGLFSDFQAAAKKGSLPAYSFLEPNWGSDGNSQHPNYNVAKGEEFLDRIYRTVRESPQWNETLLVITYDEHGGCYDHVAPPSGVAAPDDCAGQYGFDFSRLGPRVPTVLISPWISAGTVHRGQGGTPFDHTSFLKTLETRFELEPLTERDKAAPDIGDVLSLSRPRTDDPLENVVPPRAPATPPADDRPSHLQEVMAEHVARLPLADSDGGGYHHTPPHVKTGRELEDYVRTRGKKYFG